MTASAMEPATEQDTAAQASQRLRTLTAAVRLSVSWLGVRKSLSPDATSSGPR